MDDRQDNISDELIAAFLDGNVNREEAAMVLAAMRSDKVLTEILDVSMAIDDKVRYDERNILPMQALAAANPENLCSFECEAFILRHLGYDIDHWSLLETAKANNWVRENGTPLHHVGRLLELKGLNVSRKYDASLKDIVDALEAHKDVIVILDNHVLSDGISEGESSYHAIYLSRLNEKGDIMYLNLSTHSEDIIDKNEFLKAWKSSGYYMVTAVKSSTLYNPQPIDVDNIPLDADLEDLTEAIAENAHDVWARTRMNEGWTYGPVRDDAKKQHPDLVPYAKLPDSEKEYDRIMAMNTLRLVRRLGYDITKN